MRHATGMYTHDLTSSSSVCRAVAATVAIAFSALTANGNGFAAAEACGLAESLVLEVAIAPEVGHVLGDVGCRDARRVALLDQLPCLECDPKPSIIGRLL
jgi:hypothetical protein